MRRLRAWRRHPLPFFRALLPAFLLCIMTLPDPLLAARLELRLAGGESTAATALVGDIIDVDVWVDAESATLSGAAVFLSFDGDVFELVDQDRDPVVSGFQPFAVRSFFQSGEIFRNTVLADDDPAASPAGEQMDYSVVRAAESGAGAGATASFRLRALAPTAGSTIRIDESGIRETRYFMPDGSRGSFRFITPLTVAVKGIAIDGLPSQLVLARGQVDSTTFRLDDFLFDPLFGPHEIGWHVDVGPAISVHLDEQTRRLVVTAPGDRSLWEQLTMRAVNPDGQTASAVIDVFVNAGPVVQNAERIEMTEDDSYRLPLDDLVDDPDAPDAQLEWSVIAPTTLGARIEGPPFELVLEPRADWSGSGQATLTVADRFGFADTVTVDVDVTAVNDPPRSLYSPNLRVTRGKADSSLAVADLFTDIEDGAAGLDLAWAGDSRIWLDRRDGRLVVTAPGDWEGSESIELTVEDRGGLKATVVLTVTVVPSLAPEIVGAPKRLGMAAGGDWILDLNEFVVDPDDVDGDLTWSVSGHSSLLVHVSGGGGARIEAPASFQGTETVRFTASDPSGASAWFDLLVFAAPAGGEPLVAPLPALRLPPRGIDASVDLDDFVFDLDHDPAAMTWRTAGPEGLELRVDPSTHVLTVIAADSTSGEFTVELLVTDPDGHETRTSLLITVAEAPVELEPEPEPEPEPELPLMSLSLLPLPTLQLTEGGFDQSLVLDDYVEEGDPQALHWEAVDSDHAHVLVDAATRRVTLLAEPNWTGPELVLIRGFDDGGRLVVEAVMGVRIVAAAPSLELTELMETPVLAGDSVVVVDAASLLAVDVDPAGLEWSASGSRPYELTFDAASGYLHLLGGVFSAGAEVVTIVARDGAGNQATGRLLVQALPTDGSVGQERDGFQVRIVPNPVQPEFLDLFVVSDDDRYLPRLRVGASPWQDLTLTPMAAGIWHGTHALRRGMEGSVSFLALALEGAQLTRQVRQIHVGTVPVAAGKRLAAADFALDIEPGTFDDDAVVTVIPGPASDVVGELNPVGRTFQVHATAPLRSPLRLSLQSAHGPGAAHIYRWDGDSRAWRFTGGRAIDGFVESVVDRLGRYALFRDTTAPRIVAAAGAHDRFRVHDGGSGIGAVDLLSDGIRVDDGVIWSDGEEVRLTAVSAFGARLELRATDRAGNQTTFALDPSRLSRAPAAFDLGQNYPNPFNPETSIPVRVAAGGQLVRLEVFNSAGQRIRLLIDSPLPAGEHDIAWDGHDDLGRAVSSGTYLYRALVGQATLTRRMTLIR